MIEEAPSPAVNPGLRSLMGEAAVQAARAVDYEGAGTVEFLLSDKSEFYFLEMNTRLQVEHPVTELITGLDLVHMQLSVAAGLPLPMKQAEVGISGHAMEARLYAEDPSKGFLPSIGPIARFDTPDGPGIRVDMGVRTGDEVTTAFDPMLAKVIVHAPDRASAIRRLDQALSQIILHGVRSNIGFCREMLVSDSFSGPGVTTDHLDDMDPPSRPEEPIRGILSVIASAAERLGLHRAAVTSAPSIVDQHTGHPGDPFRTLSRNFP